MAGKRGQIRFYDAIVIRRVRFNDKQWILSLLIREKGLISARWTMPPETRLKGERLPSLFAHIQACVMLHNDGLHKLCSFSSLPSSYRVERIEEYQRFNLLARITFLMVRESSEEELYYALWLKFLRHEEPGTGRLTLLSDVHYAHGTWPASGECEACHGQKALKIDGPKLHCNTCSKPLAQALSSGQVNYLSHRYKKRGQLELSLHEAKLLSNWLVMRLPENVHKDMVFKRLNRNLA